MKSLSNTLLVALCLMSPVAIATGQQPGVDKAKGPLRVHPTNPRYFTDGTKNPDGSLRAVYLTGSHNWDNFQRWAEGEIQEGLTAGKLGRFTDYLDVLQTHQHNFVRLWVADTAWSPITHAAIEPQPYVRTGPGKAADGGDKFDLDQLNQAYFDELRSRVIAARDRGMYVAVMLFNSWGISRYEGTPSAVTWPYHPFSKANNINAIDGDPNGDNRGLEYHTLRIAAITKLQEAYVRKVVDTVNDLDNVLYEISNESHESSKDWQYHLIKLIKEYEAQKPKQHPVVVTGYTVPTADLFASPADAVAPAGEWNNPPAATGEKVVIVDSDHNNPHRRDPGFAWRAFLRGSHPIVMDWWSGDQWNPIRQAMGHTRKYADKMNLAAMTPCNDLASTKYCQASPKSEYLVYLPDDGEVTVDLTAATGPLAVEWMHPVKGTATPGAMAVGGDKRTLKAPFGGDAVLHIHQRVSK